MQVVNSSSVWINASNAKKQQGFTKADRARGAAFKYVFSLILLAFFCSLFYIWSRIQVVNIGYEINRSLALKEKLIEENKRLTLEAAILKSPVRLESLAHNSFQMDLPQRTQILNQWQAPKEKEAEPAAKASAPAKVASTATAKNQKLKVAAKTAKPDVKQDKSIKLKKEESAKPVLKSAKKAEAKPALKVASAAAR